VFVLAGRAVGSAAFARFQLSELEVLLELAPLRLGTDGATSVQEVAVGPDEFFIEDGEVCLRGVDVGMSPP
jgi:hypothetical protein